MAVEKHRNADRTAVAVETQVKFCICTAVIIRILLDQVRVLLYDGRVVGSSSSEFLDPHSRVQLFRHGRAKKLILDIPCTSYQALPTQSDKVIRSCETSGIIRKGGVEQNAIREVRGTVGPKPDELDCY